MSSMVGAGRLLGFFCSLFVGTFVGICFEDREGLEGTLMEGTAVSLEDMRRFLVTDSPSLVPGAGRFFG